MTAPDFAKAQASGAPYVVLPDSFLPHAQVIEVYALLEVQKAPTELRASEPMPVERWEVQRRELRDPRIYPKSRVALNPNATVREDPPDNCPYGAQSCEVNT